MRWKRVSDEFIPFSRPSLTECEIAAVNEVLRSGWWTTGKRVAEFEEAFAGYVGAEHAVALNSCTAGLHVALAAVGVGAGDGVVTSTYTFVATTEVALYLGSHPLLVDIDAETLCIDPRQADTLISALSTQDWRAALSEAVGVGDLPRGCGRYLALETAPTPRALVPVHFAGRAAAMGSLMKSARAHDIAVVEDAAHAVETRSEGQKVGAIGDATAFSFYATKNLSTGEGGMVTTDDRVLAEHMRRLALHGISKDAWTRYDSKGSWYYDVLEQGYKYNMTDIAAALGMCQLGRIEDMAVRRAAIAEAYIRRLGSVEAVTAPAFDEHDGRAWHLFVIQLDPDRLTIDRGGFIDRLKDKGIGASVHFIPVHTHPFYRARYGFETGDYPVAEAVFANCVTLPLYPDMTDAQVDRVCGAVESICEENTR